MKKRIVLIVAVAVVLVVLCAGLPRLTAMFVDKKTENAPVFSDARPMEQPEAGEALSMQERLWLYSNGKQVHIKAANATKTELEIKKCAEAFLYPCRANGIYQVVTFAHPTVTTNLIYDMDDPSRSMIVWEYYATNFQTTADGQYLGETRTINVIVDDETGKVLSVRFDHYNVSYSQNDLWERNRKRIEPLVDLYFAQLGLMEAAKAAKASPENYEYLERDTGVTEAHYTFADSTHGVKIIFATSGKDSFLISVEKLKA